MLRESTQLGVKCEHPYFEEPLQSMGFQVQALVRAQKPLMFLPRQEEIVPKEGSSSCEKWGMIQDASRLYDVAMLQ